MTGQPTNADIMNAIVNLNGDVKVALDRTATLAGGLTRVEERQNRQGLEIARAKGHATGLGSLAAMIVAGLIEAGKAMFGAHGGT